MQQTFCICISTLKLTKTSDRKIDNSKNFHDKFIRYLKFLTMPESRVYLCCSLVFIELKNKQTNILVIWLIVEREKEREREKGGDTIM